MAPRASTVDGPFQNLAAAVLPPPKGRRAARWPQAFDAAIAPEMLEHSRPNLRSLCNGLVVSSALGLVTLCGVTGCDNPSPAPPGSAATAATPSAAPNGAKMAPSASVAVPLAASVDTSADAAQPSATAVADVSAAAPKVSPVAPVRVSPSAATKQAPSTSASAKPKYACGAKGQKSCPMQGWMKGVMARALAGGDTDKIAQALSTIAAKPVAGMGSWSSIAATGAAKAKAGDIPGAKQSCKKCHALYQKRYKTSMRDQPW